MKTEDMSDRQKQERIAEACGRNVAWKCYCPTCKINIDRRNKNSYDQISGAGYHYPNGCGNKLEFSLPDYLSDLNACAEMENTVSYETKPVLLDILKRFVMRYEEGVSDWDIYTASPRQRAEAFLLTLP